MSQPLGIPHGAEDLREIPLRDVLKWSGLTARLEGVSYRARDEKHNIVVTGRRCSTTKPKPEAKVSLTFASSQDVYRFAHSNPVSLTILSVNLRVTPPAELLPTKIHNFLQAWAKVRGKPARVR